MNWRFVVVDHGLKTTTGKTGIYKILVNQTARLMNEFGRENIEIFDKLEDAKEAVLLIVKRYEEAAKQNHHQISYRPDPRIEMLRAEMSELTEDSLETFFV